MDSSQTQPTLAQPQSKRKPWLLGGSIAVALGLVAALVAVRSKPDLLVPVIKAGVPLEWAAPHSDIIYTAETLAHMPQVSAEQLKQIVDSKDANTLLLDVRTPEEYEKSRIPGAVLVPLTEIQKGQGIDKVKSLLKGTDGTGQNGQRLIVYCTHGYRSGRALVDLKRAGINGTQYPGGIQEWTEKIDPSLPKNGW